MVGEPGGALTYVAPVMVIADCVMVLVPVVLASVVEMVLQHSYVSIILSRTDRLLVRMRSRSLSR